MSHNDTLPAEDAEESPAAVHPTDLRPAAVRGLHGSTVALSIVVLALVLAPWVVDSVTLGVLNSIGLAGLGALALNLLTGFAGQVSIGNAALMLVGSFTAGLLGATAELPFVLVLSCSLVVGAVTGLLIGAPAVRLRGLYLVIATLAFHYIALFVGLKVQDAAVGSVGFVMPFPSVGTWTLDSDIKWSYVIWAINGAVLLVVARLLSGKFGRAWIMIRDAEVSAQSAGVGVSGYKLLVFALSSAIISLQGALFAYYYGSAQVGSFNLDVALQYIAMIIIGGLGTLSGSYIGAVFVLGLPYVLQLWLTGPVESLFGFGAMRDIQNIIYGLALVGFLLLQPKGMYAIFARLSNRVTGSRRAPTRSNS